MTSNDEMEAAQVVANWLRELADSYPCGVPLEKFLGSLDVGVLAGHCDYLLDSDDVGSLADFIDPTCKLRFDSVHQNFVCTHCGARFDSFQTFDGHGKWNDMRYCTNCGTRMVMQDGD